MKMGHIIKADLGRFIHSSGSRTVNTQIIRTVPFTSANTLDKMRLSETAVVPVGRVGECSIKYFKGHIKKKTKYCPAFLFSRSQQPQTLLISDVVRYIPIVEFTDLFS